MNFRSGHKRVCCPLFKFALGQVVVASYRFCFGSYSVEVTDVLPSHTGNARAYTERERERDRFHSNYINLNTIWCIASVYQLVVKCCFGTNQSHYFETSPYKALLYWWFLYDVIKSMIMQIKINFPNFSVTCKII